MGENQSNHPFSSMPEGEPVGLPPDYSTRAPSADKQKKSAREPKSSVQSTLEFIGIIIAAIVLAYLLQAFLIKPFKIPSSSMEQTLVPGDRVLVNRLSYKFGSPQRGDVIVFRSPDDPSVDFIKRVIAVEGDLIEVRQGQVILNGEPQVEDYVQVPDVSNFRQQLVPAGHVFVMGDNRPDSQDSRRWKQPWLPVDNIIGRAFMIYWPFSRISSLGGQEHGRQQQSGRSVQLRCRTLRGRRAGRCR